MRENVLCRFEAWQLKGFIVQRERNEMGDGKRRDVRLIELGKPLSVAELVSFIATAD